MGVGVGVGVDHRERKGNMVETVSFPPRRHHVWPWDLATLQEAGEGNLFDEMPQSVLRRDLCSNRG